LGQDEGKNEGRDVVAEKGRMKKKKKGRMTHEGKDVNDSREVDDITVEKDKNNNSKELSV
jgi:hypothetical protein